MKNKKTMVIGILCCALVLMGIGYALLQSTLNISGTAKASGSFDVHIVNVDTLTGTGKKTAGANNVGGYPRYNADVATLNATFNEPGDYITYQINVANTGSVDAVITVEVENLTDSDSSFNMSCDAVEGTQLAANGGTTSFECRMAFDEGHNLNEQQFGNVANGSMQVIVTAVQKAGYVAPPEPAAPDYSDTFISFEQGVLSKYFVDSSTAVIPDNLSLPVTTITYTYNNTKCVTNATLLGAEEGSEQSFCDANVKLLFGEDGTTPRTYQWLFENGGGEESLSAAPYCMDETRSNSAQSYPITTISSDAIYEIDDGIDITSITIGNGITTIESYAFEEFGYLSTVTIGSDIRNIGDRAFRRIGSNPTISIGANQSLVSLGDQAFDNGVTIRFNDNPNYVYGS